MVRINYYIWWDDDDGTKPTHLFDDEDDDDDDGTRPTHLFDEDDDDDHVCFVLDQHT